MIRKIIHIDEEKCNGSGACAVACHEGAIGMVNSKAKLLRDDYCDGWEIAFPHARPMRSVMWSERRRRMTRRPLPATKMRRKARIMRVVPAVSFGSLIANSPAKRHMSVRRLHNSDSGHIRSN